MSPSEDQLRASLRAGQGSAPDPDAIIGRALRVRHQRRVRLAGMAAAVVVVGGLGAGVAALRTSGSSGAKDASSRGAASGAAPNAGMNLQYGPAFSAGAGASNGGAGSSEAGGTSGSACPATPVRYSLAGGGGTDQFGASGSLFSGPVSSILVCRYVDAGGAALPPVQTLTDSAATSLATALDAASATLPNGLTCITALSIELIPTGTDGNAMTPISVVGGCNQAMVTNGTAVRYVQLAVFGTTPTPATSTQLQPSSGMMSGSPPR